MSISLPNGTLLANPSTQTQYTAAVTRILHLSSFPPELKTRDLQVMFKDYEAEKGGFRIKWLDDVNALVVFSDAGVAKRAYLSFLLSPPPAFPLPAKIRPYDQPDAAQIIQAMTARSMGHRSSMSSAMTSGNVFSQSHSHTQSQGQGQGGIDGLPSHSRTMSMGTNTGGGGGGGGMGAFAFPKTGRSSISSRPTSIIGGNTSTITSSHGRSGSSSFSRSSNSGLGALNFGGSSSLSNRLPTHAESLDSPNRPSAPFPVRRTTKESELSRSASSSDTEPIVVMDQAPSLPAVPGFAGWKMPSSKAPMGARRESVSAEKALREVEKALAGVEAR